MRTDHALAQLFEHDPDLIKLMLDLPEDCHYQMRSETIKEVERRLDAVFTPDDAQAPVIVGEFHGYDDKTIYFRLLGNIGMVGARQPERLIYGLLIFILPSHDPRTEPWHGLGRSGVTWFRVIYLEELVALLRERDPDHPVATLFTLILETNTQKIERAAARDYARIMKADLPKPQREVYAKLYLYWLAQRLGNLSREEVRKMTEITMTPFKETRLYKDIAGEVRDEVREEDLVRQINMLERLREQGALTQDIHQKELAPLEKELAVIRARRAEQTSA